MTDKKELQNIVDELAEVHGGEIFEEYHEDCSAADTIEEVETWAEEFEREWLSKCLEDDPEWKPYRTANILIGIREKRDASQLPQYLTSEDHMVRKIAKKLIDEMITGTLYNTFWVDIWNWLEDSNAETHGTFFALCSKSKNPELWELAIEVYEDLEVMHKGSIGFDT